LRNTLRSRQRSIGSGAGIGLGQLYRLLVALVLRLLELPLLLGGWPFGWPA
jgi:hypothetical protein